MKVLVLVDFNAFIVHFQAIETRISDKCYNLQEVLSEPPVHLVSDW